MSFKLKSLVCSHEFYWSERRRLERCRLCGKTQAGVTPSVPVQVPATPALTAELRPPQARDNSAAALSPPPMRPVRSQVSEKVLRAEAWKRRRELPTLLSEVASGAELKNTQMIDAILGVIEDAHSSDPVLFGPSAAIYLTMLQQARPELPADDDLTGRNKVLASRSFLEGQAPT